MTRRVRYLLLAVGVIAAAAWLVSSFERVTEREHTGFRGEAARNPLLALARLLDRMGIETRPLDDLGGLQKVAQDGTIVLPRGRKGYTRERAERVRSWIEGGGHLIVEAEPLRERDNVLDALKVSRRALSERVRRKPLAQLSLPHARDPLRAQIYAGAELVDQDPARTVHIQQDASGTLLLHLALGRGRVTVLPTFSFMSNASIGAHDHAALAWELVRFVPGSGVVVIAPRFDDLSIVDWLLHEARAALTAAVALVLLWLWRAGTRFGPIESERLPERRRLLDHLLASGRYLWRAGAAPRMLAAARETCLQKIARTRPALAGLAAHERAPRLAELTGLPLRDIEHAWSAEPDSPAGFTAAVRTLQQIEEKLTRRLTV